jgi:hypothetical protein
MPRGANLGDLLPGSNLLVPQRRPKRPGAFVGVFVLVEACERRELLVGHGTQPHQVGPLIGPIALTESKASAWPWGAA